MTVILIDGNNVVFRVGWVFKHLTTIEGQPTGSIYGMLNLLLRLKKKFNDACFVVAWDGDNRRASWRSKMYAGYKGNRGDGHTKESDDAYSQIPTIKKMLDIIEVPHLSVNQVEADDVIGILVERCIGRKWTPVIYSSDQDYLQFMIRGVNVIRATDRTNPWRFETEQDVQTKFRCSVKDLLKVRALAGDVSDNIPGIERGVGPVKASKMIAAGYNLESNSIAARNYALMKIVTDCDFPLFSMEARQDLKVGMRRVVDRLSRKQIPDRANVTRFLADFELADAMGKRQEISQLMVSDIHSPCGNVEK